MLCQALVYQLLVVRFCVSTAVNRQKKGANKQVWEILPEALQSDTEHDVCCRVTNADVFLSRFKWLMRRPRWWKKTGIFEWCDTCCSCFYGVSDSREAYIVAEWYYKIVLTRVYKLWAEKNMETTWIVHCIDLQAGRMGSDYAALISGEQKTLRISMKQNSETHRPFVNISSWKLNGNITVFVKTDLGTRSGHRNLKQAVQKRGTK